MPKPLDEYVRPPKCKACNKATLFVCKDRVAVKWGRKMKCHCTGYHFPHRRGSKWCEKNPKIQSIHETERRGGS